MNFLTRLAKKFKEAEQEREAKKVDKKEESGAFRLFDSLCASIYTNPRWVAISRKYQKLNMPFHSTYQQALERQCIEHPLKVYWDEKYYGIDDTIYTSLARSQKLQLWADLGKPATVHIAYCAIQQRIEDYFAEEHKSMDFKQEVDAAKHFMNWLQQDKFSEGWTYLIHKMFKLPNLQGEPEFFKNYLITNEKQHPLDFYIKVTLAHTGDSSMRAWTLWDNLDKPQLSHIRLNHHSYPLSRTDYTNYERARDRLIGEIHMSMFGVPLVYNLPAQVSDGLCVFKENEVWKILLNNKPYAISLGGKPTSMDLYQEPFYQFDSEGIAIINVKTVADERLKLHIDQRYNIVSVEHDDGRECKVFKVAREHTLMELLTLKSTVAELIKK